MDDVPEEVARDDRSSSVVLPKGDGGLVVWVEGVADLGGDSVGLQKEKKGVRSGKRRKRRVDFDSSSPCR